jgi:inosose dehydratase
MSGLLRRREFTLGIGAAALVSRTVLAAKARRDVSIGYAAITWGETGGKQAIAEIAEVGYPGIQLRSSILKDFPTPEALKAELAKAKLTFACYSGGGPSADPAKRAAEVDKFMVGATFARAAGALAIQATSPKRAAKEGDGAAALKEFGLTLNEIGKRMAAAGAPLVLHPHMAQLVQDADEVDAVLAATDPRYVKLLLDTGHYAAAGGDPAAAVKKHAKRLAMLHIKDVKDLGDPEAAKSGKTYKFVELGQGKVDFPAVFAALKTVGYRGWAVVELDSVPAGRAPRDAAAANKAFLEKTLGRALHSA